MSNDDAFLNLPEEEEWFGDESAFSSAESLVLALFDAAGIPPEDRPSPIFSHPPLMGHVRKEPTPAVWTVQIDSTDASSRLRQQATQIANKLRIEAAEEAFAAAAHVVPYLRS